MLTASIRSIDRFPTEAQKRAGNYAKGHVRVHGLDIAIENPKGAARSGVGGDGRTWSVKMPSHYGYIKRTEGADGDHVDVYLGPHLKSPRVYVIDQKDADSGKFDEHKAFIGFASKPHVVATYRKAFSDGRSGERLGAIHEMSVGAFKDWLNRDTTKPIAHKSEAEKLPHASVGYVYRSRVAGEDCAKCSMFVPSEEGGTACTLVRKPIVAAGWCRRFDLKKPGYASGGAVGYADGGASFDPDSYLAASGSGSASGSKEFNPDAYLGTPPKPDIGYTRAALEGVKTGMSANLADELEGLSAAGTKGILPEGPVGNAAKAVLSGLPGGSIQPHIMGLARLGYEYLTNHRNLSDVILDRPAQPGPATEAYQQARDAERQRLKTAKEQYPGTTLTGEIGGALGVPATAGIRGATLAGRMGLGALTGAGYGAVSGFGEGEGLTDSATKAGIGAPLGAVAGAIAPPLVEGAIRAGSHVVAPLWNAARGAINPEKEAARKIVTAIDRDITTDPSAAGRLTPQEFASGVRSGDPVTIADIGGETTRALARSAANTSPEGRDILNRTVNNRFESQNERVTDWLNRTFGPSDTGATREALQGAARQANRPAYARAYREGDQPLWSDELQRLVGSPDVVDAMKAAAKTGKSRAIVDGFGGFNSPVQVSDSGVMTFTRGPGGQPTYPNLQFWDYTRRELSNAAQEAARKGSDQAGVLKQLAGSMNNELDRLVPSYQQARAGAARFFGADSALEAGENFLKGNMAMPDARRAFAALSPAEQDLFRQGYIQSLVNRVETTGDRRNILNAIAASPRAQQQMDLVMGPQRSREFEAMMRVEGIMDRIRGAVQGNSTTARQLAELGLAGSGAGMMGVGSYSMDPKEIGLGALMTALAGGGRHIDQRVSRRVAEMLMSNIPAVLRQGVQVVARSQNFMNALRGADHRITMAGTQRAPLTPIQGALPGYADQQQQQ